MSKRLSNSRSRDRRGTKVSARQTVRYGWRKRRAFEIIRRFKEAQAGIVRVEA